MESSTTDMIITSRAALVQAGNLLVQYAFSIVGAILLLAIGWMASRLLHRWVLSGLLRIRHFDQTLARFLANFLRYAVLILVMVAALGQFGVQTASILAALGAAGLAIGLALQGTLQNIAAGIMLLLLRPFRVGETIEVGAISGTVQEIGLFATELRTGDGLYLLAPNASLWNQPVKNFSRLGTRRFEIGVILPLDADVRQAEATLLRLASRDTRIRSNPAPVVSITEMTDATMRLALGVWFDTPVFGAGSRDLAKAVKIAFDKVRTEPADARVAAE